MFYNQQLFVKKGSLSRLWIAGTIFRKLSKKEIQKQDISKLCGQISHPPLPLALPAQSTLLRGICRIENKQAQFLFGDAINAKNSMTRRAAAKKVDLPPGHEQAAYSKITMEDPKPQEIVFLDLDALPLEDASMPSAAENMGFTFTQDQPEQDSPYYDAPREDESEPLDEDLVLFDVSLMEEGDLDRTHEGQLSKSRSLDEVSPAPRPMTPTSAGYQELNLGLEDLDEEIREPSLPPEEAQPSLPPPPLRKKRKLGLRKMDKRLELRDEDIERNINQTGHSVLVDRKSLLSDREIFKSYVPRKGAWKSADIIKNYVDSGPGNALSDKLKTLFTDQAVLEKLEKVREVEAGRRAEAKGVQRGEEELSVDLGGPELDMEFLDEVEEARVPSDYESTALSMEMARGEMESVASRRSFLGVELEELRQFQAGRRESIASFEEGTITPESTRSSKRLRAERKYFPTPEIDVTLSQYQLPIMEESQVAGEEGQGLSEITKVFKDIVENSLDEAGRESLTFDAILKGAIGPRRILRSEVALSLMQVLILRSLEVISARQSEPYGPIEIAKAEKWDVSFTSSQM